MISVKDFTIIRDTTHNVLLIISALFLLSSLALLSKGSIFPTSTAKTLHGFLLMPTFFLALFDVIASIVLRILQGKHTPPESEIPSQIRTILYTFIILSMLITLLFYAI